MDSALGLVLGPVAGAVLAASARGRAAKLVALVTMLAVAILAVAAGVALAPFDAPAPGATDAWFAVDASNAAFALLTAIVFPAVLAGAWDAPEMDDRSYLVALLALESALFATFLAQDLLVLFVAWEAALLPMLLMIVRHGGPGRVRAALTFFLYTMAGSVPFLAAVIVLGSEARTAGGEWTFALATLQALPLDDRVQTFVFAAIAFACAIKSPVFPLHGWLPSAYGEAPASATALMAGVLSKMGAFGLLRLAIPLAPAAAARYATPMVALGVASLLYGAVLAMRQERPRLLIAHASLSHMGYVVVGAFTLTAPGLQGALLQVPSHGLAVAGLFLLVGLLERRAARDPAAAFALATNSPRLATVLVLFVLASIALPTTSGFAAEFLVLLGAFQRGLVEWEAGRGLALGAAAFASAGVLLGATYMLRLVRAHVFGGGTAKAPSGGHGASPSGAPDAALAPGTPAVSQVPGDLGTGTLVVCAALLAAIFAIGLWPAPLMRLAEPAVAATVTAAEAARAD